MKHLPQGVRPLGFSPGRRLQLMIDPRDDPYRARRKPRGTVVCPGCGLVCVQGRWQVGSAAEPARRESCPACRRIHDRMPAGIVHATGPFAYEHRADVIGTARHFAERMQSEHPLQRIIAIDERDDGVEITTTDVHLAQGIGRALYNAFRGRLHYAFSEGEYLLRVEWAA